MMMEIARKKLIQFFSEWALCHENETIPPWVYQKFSSNSILQFDANELRNFRETNSVVDMTLYKSVNEQRRNCHNFNALNLPYYL